MGSQSSDGGGGSVLICEGAAGAMYPDVVYVRQGDSVLFFRGSVDIAESVSGDGVTVVDSIDDLDVVVEGEGDRAVKSVRDGLWVFEGVFQRSDVRNANKRTYPRRLWERILAEGTPVRESLKSRSMLGHLEHPKDGRTDGNLGAIITTDLRLKEDGTVWGRGEVLSTPAGKILREYTSRNVRWGVSSRGSGSVGNDGTVKDDYTLRSFDAVMAPSTPGAYPSKIGAGVGSMESGGGVSESHGTRGKRGGADRPDSDAESITATGPDATDLSEAVDSSVAILPVTAVDGLTVFRVPVKFMGDDALKVANAYSQKVSKAPPSLYGKFRGEGRSRRARSHKDDRKYVVVETLVLSSGSSFAAKYVEAVLREMGITHPSRLPEGANDGIDPSELDEWNTEVESLIESTDSRWLASSIEATKRMLDCYGKGRYLQGKGRPVSDGIMARLVDNLTRAAEPVEIGGVASGAMDESADRYRRAAASAGDLADANRMRAEDAEGEAAAARDELSRANDVLGRLRDELESVRAELDTATELLAERPDDPVSPVEAIVAEQVSIHPSLARFRDVLLGAGTVTEVMEAVESFAPRDGSRARPAAPRVNPSPVLPVAGAVLESRGAAPDTRRNRASRNNQGASVAAKALASMRAGPGRG